jgi:hypothetical protein
MTVFFTLLVLVGFNFLVSSYPVYLIIGLNLSLLIVSGWVLNRQMNLAFDMFLIKNCMFFINTWEYKDKFFCADYGLYNNEVVSRNTHSEPRSDRHLKIIELMTTLSNSLTSRNNPADAAMLLDLLESIHVLYKEKDDRVFDLLENLNKEYMLSSPSADTVVGRMTQYI